MLIKIILFSSALLAAACQVTHPAVTSVPQPATSLKPAPAEPFGGGSEKLFAHRWALTEATGQPVPHTGDANEAHMLFFPLKRLVGSTGCNRLTGTFELLGSNRIQFSPLATTRMSCPPTAAETRFVQALHTAQTYSVTDAALVLTDGQTTVARFRATPEK